MLGYGQREVNLTIGGNKIKAREIVLPMPPTENNRHQPVKRGSHVALCNTTVYNKWLNMAKHALMKGKLPRIDGDVTVIFTVVFPDMRRRDAQNREKATFDAFTQSGCVYEDDCNIRLHITRKEILKDEMYVLAYVMPYEEFKLEDLLLSEEFLKTTIEKAKEEDYAEQQRNGTSKKDR